VLPVSVGPEIRLIDLNPAQGSEANKRRPGVIVSNDRANATATRDATGLAVNSKAQAEQIRSVAVERVGPAVGRVPTDLMADLDNALRVHLQR
jgi:mRNA interferase MazF